MNTDKISCFIDSNVGMTTEGFKIEEIHNDHGQHYFKATTRVNSIFGHEFSDDECGKLEAIGKTREIAIERLKKELKDFNDSLWA